MSWRVSLRAPPGACVVVLLASLAVCAGGCGGGAPLLHPARTLPAGDVRMSGGISANISPGSLGNDLKIAKDSATKDPTVPGAPGSNPEYAKGALVAAAIGPGLAPYVSARVGIGNRFESGLTYTGRAVRVDLRRSFDVGKITYSAGLGLSAVLYGRQQSSELPNVDLGSLHGYGGDIPLLVGWESTGGLYKLWGGARGGYEHVIISTESTEPSAVQLGGEPLRLDADRTWGGAVVGMATGFNHLHVAIEISAAYQVVSGTYFENTVTVRGITLAPATALWFSF